MIQVEVIGGLGNRLMALVSAICLAEDLKRPLNVYWPEYNPKCFGKFHDYFENTYDPRFVRVLNKPVQTKKEVCTSEKQALHLVANNISLLSYTDFHKSDPLRWRFWLQRILPKYNILRKVRENIHVMPETSVPIGVHIRRTDCYPAIAYSPLWLFEKEMGQIQNGFFFACSDDSTTIQQMKAKFPGRIYNHERLRNRHTVAGVEEAIVSLYTLASCNFILGSYGSSFSKIASKMGSNKIKTIKHQSGKLT